MLGLLLLVPFFVTACETPGLKTPIGCLEIAPASGALEATLRSGLEGIAMRMILGGLLDGVTVRIHLIPTKLFNVRLSLRYSL